MFGRNKRANVEEVDENIDEFKQEAKDKYKKFMRDLEWNREKVRWYVRYNPEKALLLSFGAGAVAGTAVGLMISFLMRRRR